MKGSVQIRCAECGRTREVSGEMPEEYTACFRQVVEEDGFVPRPGAGSAFICGKCLLKFAGHETVDDEDKVQGKRNPKEV